MKYAVRQTSRPLNGRLVLILLVAQHLQFLTLLSLARPFHFASTFSFLPQ